VSPKNLGIIISIVTRFAPTTALAQQPPQQPQVKVNVLNVCTPSPEEQKEISSALAKIPKQPLFSADFEVDRGRSTLSENPGFLQPGSGAQMSSDTTALWVRIRRELTVQALFSTVQYSFSVDPKSMVETLVFRVRDPKDLMLVSIEDSASAVTSATAMLAASTPANRIKLERFGKSSVVLARCTNSENGPPPDQGAYEPLFHSATAIVANYRNLLGARHTVPDELARTREAEFSKGKPAGKPDTKKPPAEKK
jgi:hypothetical protein